MKFIKALYLAPLLFLTLAIGIRAQTPENRFEKQVQAYEAADKTTPPPKNAILLVGDSQFFRWKTLAEDLPDFTLINRGIDSFQFSDILHFYDRLILPYKPRMIVLHVGGNDVHNGKSAERVREDFKTFVAKVRATQPKIPIAFSSLTPGPGRWDEADKRRQTNKLLKAYIATQKNLHFIDLWDAMLTKDGQPREDLWVADRIHPNHEGYLVRVKIMRPLLGKPDKNANNYQGLIKEWNQPVKPFHLIGNIYYVGTNFLACYVIKTSAGLILLDTAMQESAPLLRANIESLGFKLSDIKIILSSHAHFDHVAGHADMKAATGAKVYAMKADAEIMESGGRKGFHPLEPYYKPIKVDRLLKDGAKVKLGDVTMTAHLTPGHTEGNTTWTMKSSENGQSYDVVFVGSLSINPGVRMVNNPTWAGVADAYAKSFAKLKTLPCDVFLGPHGIFFNLDEKMKRLGTQPNPFMDRQGLRQFIEMNEKNYLAQIQRERNYRSQENVPPRRHTK